MKYIKLSGSFDEYVDMANQYESYLDTIRDKLPHDLALLDYNQVERVKFQDGLVATMKIDMPENCVRIQLYNDLEEPGSKVVGERWYTLTYRKVISFVYAAPDPSTSFYPGILDHAHDEIELIDAATYEHRMLFHNGVEIQVRFMEFSLTWEEEIYPLQPNGCIDWDAVNASPGLIKSKLLLSK